MAKCVDVTAAISNGELGGTMSACNRGVIGGGSSVVCGQMIIDIEGQDLLEPSGGSIA